MALTDKLTNIANAIREKTGGVDLLSLDQMPTEILSIETGGSDENAPLTSYPNYGVVIYKNTTGSDVSQIKLPDAVTDIKQIQLVISNYTGVCIPFGFTSNENEVNVWRVGSQYNDSQVSPDKILMSQKYLYIDGYSTNVGFTDTKLSTSYYPVWSLIISSTYLRLLQNGEYLTSSSFMPNSTAIILVYGYN